MDNLIPVEGEVKEVMADLKMTVHIADIEEVKTFINCTAKLVKAIKKCNFNNYNGFPLELTAPYRDLVLAIDALEDISKNRLRSANSETVKDL